MTSVKIETHIQSVRQHDVWTFRWIPIHQQDLYTLPFESFLYIKGRLMVKKRNDHRRQRRLEITAWRSCLMKFELNGVEIDRNRNVGVISTIKNYVSLTYEKSSMALNRTLDIVEKHFNFCVPFNVLLGLRGL